MIINPYPYRQPKVAVSSPSMLFVEQNIANATYIYNFCIVTLQIQIEELCIYNPPISYTKNKSKLYMNLLQKKHRNPPPPTTDRPNHQARRRAKRLSGIDGGAIGIQEAEGDARDF